MLSSRVKELLERYESFDLDGFAAAVVAGEITVV